MIQFIFMTGLLVYTLFSIGAVHPGRLKNLVFFLLLAGAALLPPIWDWAAAGILILFFDLFYDEEGFLQQWPYLALPWFIGFGLRAWPLLFAALLSLTLSVYRRELRQPVTYVKPLLLGLLEAIPFPLPPPGALLLKLGVALLIWSALELTRHSYRTGYERSTRSFQQRVLLHQYQEMKDIYLNMRGWRHDYHNHIQSVKAYLSMGQTGEAQAYLDELDSDLTRVDPFVRSGNLMVDAILNSKLSLAEQQQIRIDCTTQLPESLILSDVDLCVLLGNLLDNAIEACQQIEADKRFLRIYMALLQDQLYISVQNAAKEILNFDERHYITTKRGQHGLGLMRVKLLVDKYEGYLNLQNEPGIFAAEITLPNHS